LKRTHPYRWERDEFVLEDFRFINQAAYWDYQREKVYVRMSKLIRRKPKTVRHLSRYRSTRPLILCRQIPARRAAGLG
jgi:hypothetical protein